MKVKIVKSKNKSELDNLINTCIQNRYIYDIKFTTTALHEAKTQYTALIVSRS